MPDKTHHLKSYLALCLMTIINGCTSGSSTATVKNPSILAQYKSLLKYSPLNSNQNNFLTTTQNNQQSFSTNTTITLTNVRVQFFSNNNCTGLIETIDMTGGSGVEFPAGTYTSTNASNFALCNKYSSGGCSDLYALFESGSAQSMLFTYSYAAASGGPGAIPASCMSGTASSSFRETILNWAANGGNSPWAACSDSSNCGFSQPYGVTLPESYNSPIININPVTFIESNMMGSMFQFKANITGQGSATVTASFANPAAGVISSDTSPCSLTVGGVESCTFTVFSQWNTELANSSNFNYQIPINATNNATIIGAPYTYMEVTPAVYLAAIESGISSESNIGITYGESGVINPRFTVLTDNESNCVLDNLTGLIWAKNAMIGFEATDSGGPVTQPDYSNTNQNLNRLNYSNATIAIGNMNTATEKLCGHDDWRLPTITELTSIINYGTKTNYGDWLNNSGFINAPTVQTSQYWSNTSYVSGTIAILNFGNAPVNNQGDSSQGGIWPVRSTSNPNPVAKLAKPAYPSSESGVTWPTPRFIAYESDCVVDKLTGLTWVKNGTLIPKQSWAAAQITINNMNATPGAAGYHLCGYNDWRFPNILELRSLVNYQADPSSLWLNNNGFMNMESVNYWTGTLNTAATATQNNIGNPWVVTMTNGASPANIAPATEQRTLPVRGGY